MIRMIIVPLLLPLLACERESPTEMPTDFDPDRQVATDVRMIFSDSAQLQFIIQTPRLETYVTDKVVIEEFPQGISIQFYDENKVIQSSISAERAVRKSALGLMELEGNVRLENAAHDVLISPKILWNEVDHTLSTAKYIQLIRSATGDTLHGFGFEAKDDFSRFRITKATGKQRYNP